jgi:ribonuclease P protein component
VKRSFRLKRSNDFKRVRSSGKSYAHPFLVLIASPFAEPRVRIGVTAGRNVGGAVQRNRAKRVLREAFRFFLPRIRSGWDLIAIARAPLAEATLTELQEALAALLARAKLLNDDE